MLFENSYKSVAQKAKSIFKERGSVFEGYVFPICNKGEFDLWLKKVKTKHVDASHCCWAYMLHPDKSEFSSSDDGEPANSAGKPILRMIQKFNLTQILIIVVRYYGGVNLGIPGLISAYQKASSLAITKAGIMEVDIKDYFEVIANFGAEKQWYCLLNHPLIQTISQESFQQGYKSLICYKKKDKEEASLFLNTLFELNIKFLYFG